MQVCGYPSDKESCSMWQARGACKKVTETYLKYRIPTESGQSGSPVIREEGDKFWVVGVHIGAVSQNNIAVRLNSEKRKIINTWG